MALFPGAIYRPITANKGRDRLTVWNRVNVHVAAGTSTSLFGFFNVTGRADSHFYVRFDGSVEQYVDTAWQAFADLEGNDATISIENQGMGDGPLTAAQLKTNAEIYAWVVRTHGVAKRIATSSKAGDESKGLSWHRLGIDGNFPALPSILAGRLQRGGGMRYSKSTGKVCPGDHIIRQIPEMFAIASKILEPPVADATVEELLEDEVATLFRRPDGPTFLAVGGKAVGISTGEDLAALQAAGIELAEVRIPLWDKIAAALGGVK